MIQRLKKVLFVLVVVFLINFSLPLFTLAADPDLTGGADVTSVSGITKIISDIQITGTGNPTVPVRLFVSNGTLSLGSTTGLTFTGGTSGSTLQFSGTLTNVNNALQTLRYIRTGTGTDTLEVTLVQPGEVFFPDNGHLYEYVSFSGNWASANTNAGTRTKYGATGYLTTITSQAENDFVADRLLGAGWMGASDSATEGDWKWVTGPEAGTSFWSGTSTGSAVSGRYNNWANGEPNDWSNGNPGEDCAQFLSGGTGEWNDLNCTSNILPGYVVEYGSPSSPIDVASLDVNITTVANVAPNAPTNLTLSGAVNGFYTNDNTPTFTFNASDVDGPLVRYQIQIDNNSDFSSPNLNFTSGLVGEVSFSYTFGTTSNPGQTLADGNYYWRVRSIDEAGVASSYVTANSGQVALIIDTQSPTAVTFSPTNGAIDIERKDIVLEIEFSHIVYQGIGNIEIRKEGGELISSIPVTSPQISGFSTDTITITPSATLPGGSVIYILIDNTAFKDIANNNYAGISANNVWSFTTRSAGGGGFETPPSCSLKSNKEKVYLGEAFDLQISVGSARMPFYLYLENNKTEYPGNTNSITLIPSKETEVFKIFTINTWGANYCELEINASSRPIEVIPPPAIEPIIQNPDILENTETQSNLSNTETNKVKPINVEIDFKELLRRGQRGDNVRTLQRIFNFITPESQITVDGIFGRQTLAKTIEVQKIMQIETDGIVGPITSRSLEAKLEEILNSDSSKKIETDEYLKIK